MSIEIPAAIDPHVHTRGFDQSYKETIITASRAAIAGGVGTILAMPNYDPRSKRPFTRERLVDVRNQASSRLAESNDNHFYGPYCDVGFWATALPGESDREDQLRREQRYLVQLAHGTKGYVEITQGQDVPLTVADFMPYWSVWHDHAKPTQPIAAHVEDENVEEAIFKVADKLRHPLYIPHINNRFLMEAFIKAKKAKLPVYGEVTLDHLFHTEELVAEKGWFARMKPRLARQEDVDFIWDNIGYIDCFGTDHAPHTEAETINANVKNPEGNTGPEDVKSFGTPTIEAYLPLLVGAVLQGRLTEQQLIDKTSRNAARIFGIAVDKQSVVTMVEEDYEFSKEHIFSGSGWNAFEGEVMHARVQEVKLHGTVVFRDGAFTDAVPQGQVLAPSL